MGVLRQDNVGFSQVKGKPFLFLRQEGVDKKRVLAYPATTMITRTKNWFYSSNRFLSGAFWSDMNAGWLLWPAVWVEPKREPSLDVTVTRLSVGWLRWRAQCDFGRWHPIDVFGALDWEHLGVDAYLQWTKRTFGRNWGRADVERLFRQEPAWRRLCMMGTLNNHYIRVAVARAMLLAPAAPISTPRQLSEVLGGDPKSASTSQRPWTDAVVTETNTPESLVDELEHLGRNLKRRATDSEE